MQPNWIKHQPILLAQLKWRKKSTSYKKQKHAFTKNRDKKNKHVKQLDKKYDLDALKIVMFVRFFVV